MIISLFNRASVRVRSKRKFSCQNMTNCWQATVSHYWSQRMFLKLSYTQSALLHMFRLVIEWSPYRLSKATKWLWIVWVDTTFDEIFRSPAGSWNHDQTRWRAILNTLSQDIGFPPIVTVARNIAEIKNRFNKTLIKKKQHFIVLSNALQPIKYSRGYRLSSLTLSLTLAYPVLSISQIIYCLFQQNYRLISEINKK